MTDKTPFTIEGLIEKITTRSALLADVATRLDRETQLGSLVGATAAGMDGMLQWLTTHLGEEDLMDRLKFNLARDHQIGGDPMDLPLQLACGETIEQFPEGEAAFGNNPEQLLAQLMLHHVDGQAMMMGPDGVAMTADLSDPEAVQALLRAMHDVADEDEESPDDLCRGCRHPRSAHDDTGVCALCEAEVTVTEAMFGFQDEDRMAEQDATDEADSVARAEAQADRDQLGE